MVFRWAVGYDFMACLTTHTAVIEELINFIKLIAKIMQDSAFFPEKFLKNYSFIYSLPLHKLLRFIPCKSALIIF